MNIQQAKEIDIISYLEKSGYQGVKKGQFVLFKSPLRDEKTPSFSVDPKKNKWLDFGSGQSGDILDLVKLLFSTNTSGALEKLSALSFDKQTIGSTIETLIREKEPGIKLEWIQSVKSRKLLDYLELRKIPLSLSKIYLKEAHYTVNDRKYFSIAFTNDLGGFELRNLKFKNCIPPKYYTSFPVPGSKELNLFEGGISFLSALVYYKIDALPDNTIILNSVTNLHHIISILPRYRKVNSYLDLDLAGNNALDQVRHCNGCVENKSIIIHPNHKDFNEYIMHR